MTKRLLLLQATAVLVASGAPAEGDAAGRFEIKLSPEQKICQVVNRLTFGARPGDLDQIRKLGVDKWIELQLHPERVPENPAVDRLLQPLEAIRMDAADIIKTFYPQFQPAMLRRVQIGDLLTPEQSRKVHNGTAEERRAALMALDPEKRMKVLAQVPPNVTEGLPDLQKEQTAARRMQQEEQQAEMRRQRPPLGDLLNPDQAKVANSGTPVERAALFASLDDAKRRQVAVAVGPAGMAGQPGLRRVAEMSRTPQYLAIGDLREARVYRAVYSNRQLEEVLTDFWMNHFNVFEAKGQVRPMLAAFERDAIRPHVFGKFKDLLLATARQPAMLYYLDNWESMTPTVFDVGPFAPGPFGNGPQFGRQAHGLNENYGRELMELHTLGVNGGYTQQDVIAVARCFTGWTIRLPNQKPEFAFAAFMHDTSEKTALGHKIPAGGGEQDGLQVIDILAHHPSTARFISTKLARHFVADNPPAALIDRMAHTFLKTDGDLRAVLEVMFASREFSSEGAWESKIKSPLEMVVSAARTLDANVEDAYSLVLKISDMGEPLYAKEAPTGYKDNAEAWLSTAGVMARMDFAGALTTGKIPGVAIDWARFQGKDPAAIVRELLAREPSAQTIEAMEKGFGATPQQPAMVAAVAIASPDFQRK
jgi:uncharacterized protein (DUF1800 family)